MRALCLVLLLAGRAIAQPAVTPEQPLEAFLTQRVAEELAADGTLLSRLGVTLQIEIVGTSVIVSLVDSSTKRVVASTKIDRAVGDREAAVAQVTQVAGSLADQIAHAPARGPDIVVVDAGKDERERLAAREYQFAQEAITFGALSSGNWGCRPCGQAPFRGAVHRPLSETEFFDAVERPDLADAYRARRRAGIALTVAGSAAILGGVAMLGLDIYDRNTQRDIPDWRSAPGIGAVELLGTIGLVVGVYYLSRALPIDTDAVYDLATAHNKKLRAKLQLPLGVAF